MQSKSLQLSRLLLQPCTFGDMELANRIVMAPSSEEPRAMPLNDFVQETMEALASDSNEIMVPRAKLLREQAGLNESVFVTSFNEQLEAPQA